MDDQFQHKFEQLLKLKDIYTHKNVLPQRMQRLKLIDLNFQINQIRQQQSKRLDQIINSTIRSYKDGRATTERSVSKQFSNMNISDQQNVCLSCEKYIFEKKVELICSTKFHHSYHSQCLSTILKQQLANQCCYFQCFCKAKINTGDIMRSGAVDLQVLINRLNENQATFIRSHYDNIKVCANKNCNFYWIDNSQRKRSQSHSPVKSYKITYINYCPDCRFG